MALGASAGIMSIVVAAGTIAPDYSFRLLFIGDVKLKFIVLALLIIDLISITSNTNTGGHFSHLGGAFSVLFLSGYFRKATIYLYHLTEWQSIFNICSPPIKLHIEEIIHSRLFIEKDQLHRKVLPIRG